MRELAAVKEENTQLRMQQRCASCQAELPGWASDLAKLVNDDSAPDVRDEPWVASPRPQKRARLEASTCQVSPNMVQLALVGVKSEQTLEDGYDVQHHFEARPALSRDPSW